MRNFKPGDEIIAEFRSVGAEFLTEDLAAYLKEFTDSGRNNVIPALNAIAEITAVHWGEPEGPDDQETAYGGHDPEMMVEVPFWALLAITKGWLQFQDAEGRQSLEQSFGFRSLKAGSRSTVSTDATVRRAKMMALEVAYCLGDDPQRGDVARVIAEVAKRHNVSEDTVKNAWREHGVPVAELLRQAQQRAGLE